MTAYPSRPEASGFGCPKLDACHCLIKAVSPLYPNPAVSSHNVRLLVLGLGQLPLAVCGA